MNDFDAIDALMKPVHFGPMFPWTHRTEDQWAAREAVKVLYASLSLPAPRMAWAPSPATMHRASRMLRTVQSGGSSNMVQALVPQGPDSIEREARVALLAMMIDPDVSTQSGGLIIKMIQDVFGRESTNEFPSLADMRRLLRFDEKDPSGTWAPAMFAEQCMWPAFYGGFRVPRLEPLRSQALIIMPFAKLCWICRPPLYIRTDEFDRLHAVDAPAAEWPDGFKVYCDRTPKDERLPEPTKTLLLPEVTE